MHRTIRGRGMKFDGIAPEGPIAAAGEMQRGGFAPPCGARQLVPQAAYPASTPTPRYEALKAHRPKARTNRKPLNRNLRIRLNEDEDKSLETLAKSSGAMTRSRIIRQLIREAIGQGPDLLENDLESFREAVRQLGSLGRNINQIARALNSGCPSSSILDQTPLKAVQQQIASVQKEVLDLVQRSRNRWVCVKDGRGRHGS